MIKGLNHLTLAVSDLDRSFRFYVDVVGLKPLCRWAKGAYLLAGDQWFCLNVDRERVPTADYTHYAFDVTESDFATLEKRIRSSGATIFQENKSPGLSLYFLDADGHKLEIHAGSWQDRLSVMREQNREAEFFV